MTLSIALGGVIVVALVGLLLLLRPSPQPASAEPPPLTPEQKAYLSEISVTDAKMSAAENYLGQTIVYLNAKITNQGSKRVKRVDLDLEFHDVLDQVVHREAAHPIRPGGAPLDPGQTRSFVVAFEHIPGEWNQGPPVITTKYVGF